MAAAETCNMVEIVLECARHEREFPTLRKNERSVTSPQKLKGNTFNIQGGPGPSEGAEVGPLPRVKRLFSRLRKCAEDGLFGPVSLLPTTHIWLRHSPFH